MPPITPTKLIDQLERKRGSIVRIKLENFMTIVSCEVRPGPRLNIILGPNGSGKSTLVCAIGLGLGGNPKTLGRSLATKEFVRKGADGDGLIEIELYDPSGNVIIERYLSQEKNESTWKVNRKKETEKRVQEILRGLEIQVDNLVQFLPQERVAEFARFSELQLLKETVRSVLGTEHLRMQEEIAKEQQDVNNCLLRIELKQQELSKLQEEIVRMKQSVQRQKDRETLVRDLDVYKKKLPHIRFEESRENAKAAREELKRLNDLPQNGPAWLQPMKVSAKQISTQFEKSKKDFEKALNEHKAWEKAMEEKREELKDAMTELDEYESEIKENGANRLKAKKTVEMLRRKILKFENQLENAEGDEVFDSRLLLIREQINPLLEKERDLKVKISILSSEQSRKSSALATIRRSENLKDIQDRQSRFSSSSLMSSSIERDNKELIEKLRVHPTDKPRIHLLRQEARAIGSSKSFKSKIVGPLICELRAKDEQASKALEYVLRPNTWKMFVCTSAADMDKVMEMRVSAICIAQVPPAVSDISRPYARDKLQSLGIRGYLDELLACDPLSIEAARRLNQIHQVLVGTEDTDRTYSRNPPKFQQELMSLAAASARDRLTLITPQYRFEVTKSRYGDNDLTVRVTGLDPTKLLALPLDRSVQEEEELIQKEADAQQNRSCNVQQKQTLADEIAALSTEISEQSAKATEVDRELARLRDARKAEQVKREAERKIHTQLETVKAKLISAERTANQNWDGKVDRARERAEATRVIVRQACVDLVETAAECEAITRKVNELTLTKNQLEVEKTVLTQRVQKEEHNIKNRDQALKQAKAIFDELLKQTNQLKQQADAICPLNDEIINKFRSLPDTSEELQNEIDFREFNIDRITDDPLIVRQYNEHTAKVKEITEFLEDQEVEIERKKDRLYVSIENWISPVRKMAEEINQKIGHFFREINKAGYQCAGEVSLYLKDEKDVNSYGMMIKVKFRQDQKMSRLDHNVQSGGERSLTTFLYMLALQELSAVPFRVVDEINQGMDADKERLAFYRLADVSSSPKTLSQYFMATPKLLPGLRYPKNATILFVFNGTYNLQQDEWDLDRFLQAQHRRRLSSASGDRPAKRLLMT